MEISLNDTEIDDFALAYESPNRYNYDYHYLLYFLP